MFLVVPSYFLSCLIYIPVKLFFIAIITVQSMMRANNYVRFYPQVVSFNAVLLSSSCGMQIFMKILNT